MSVSNAIKAVKEIADDLVVLPENQAYDEISASYFSGLERDLKPACFVTPSSAKQVADVVKALKPFADNLKLAVCGSGQQCTPEVANVRDGITIHMRNLRGIDVDTGKKIVSIAAGEQMGNVYEKVVALGFGVQGNRHATGGIGGDALQGGLSYFSYARGFVCDDVVNYEVVLASGEIVNANASTNSDLWSSLKGGGNNFGIITRFDLEIFEQGPMWGGKLFYFEPSFPNQIQSLVDYLHDPNAERDVHICVSLGYAAAFGSVMCMNDIFCARPEKPKSLEPFANVQPQIDQMNTLRVEGLKVLTTAEFSGAVSNRVVKMTTTVKADTGILEFAHKTFGVAFEKLKDVPNVLFSLTFEPLPVSMLEASKARGKNALGLAPSDGPLVVILFYSSWDNPEDDKKVFNVSKDAINTIEKDARDKDLFSQYKYLNYALEHQDPIGSYGSESTARLKAVSAKYDPEGFFKAVGAGPHLGN